MRVTCEADHELTTAWHTHPTGHLDAHGSTHFWEVVADRLTEQRPSLLIDMRKVELLSSAGVGTLIRLMTRVQQLRGSLAIHGCSHRVKAILAVVGVESVLNLRETEDEARARLRELGTR
jgi:anti-anti-sigma factor